MAVVDSFNKILSGFTSDHTYQAVKVETMTQDDKEISLSGMTWNLMNKGHGNNNPLNITESDKTYELRKEKQLKFLEKKLLKLDLDFLFLQEVDIFTKSPLAQTAINFLRDLKKYGWAAVHSDKADNLNHPLLTLYNTKKLHFVAKRPLFEAKSGGFTGLESEFVYIPTSSLICLTNIYLDSNTDHNQEISEYQQAQVDKNKITIIGGDTNPDSGVEYHGIVGDINIATSIKSLMREENENGD